MVQLKFEPREPSTVSVLKNVQKLDKCVFMRTDQFGKFVRDLLNYLKQSKCTYYNSIIGQLITTHQDTEVEADYASLLARILLADNIIVTDIAESVFLRKLKVNKFTDNINYLILPNFTLWDHNFLVFLNKKFNSKKVGGLVNVWGAMQKISLSQGVIKDLIQNKNGYAGQYLYSTFLNTSSFYANVLCLNGANEIVPPQMSIDRYYGRRVDNVRVWNTRHPNISQLSTQFSRVIQSDSHNWNVKVGLGTFVGANRDCDGDKEVITFLPLPNSLIELESLLYNDPKYSFLSFDKNRLSFVSQQVYYLYKARHRVESVLKELPLIYTLWTRNKNQTLSKKLDQFFTDVVLMFSSNMATLLFKEMCKIIDQQIMVCPYDDVFKLDGCFGDIVNSGAKGSTKLIENTKQYANTKEEDVAVVANRAIAGLNSHITSHGRVKFSGGDIYHNTVIFLNLYLHKNCICYKRNDVIIGDICHLPEQFLFPTHLLDMVLDGNTDFFK
ncbi:late expression factor 9 [Phthorimaea operculella granulovirus]|uniref:Late expression factor 9 n=1 Tax=Phthorimaea operculella granulovirus TaxID=192584 RepID=Q8JRV0_9BBAC|nr:late expression factor 9 [Phthorimaea operculella granulovirus]AAM70307.1 late expression factor 9 [Phthorimaea operculella granulovirus]ANY57498.1 late expression factor 9 [Phthorimaea operculella granulovirus]QBH65944.1 late expression factor 9 [Phthorimaea operculella granulovirus]QBH66074.1 late expression factor 9 [Phthorimaea operculella granulovirus]QBH66204.1 late expression factor 9 [Phthorimaea operculella granulovirus]